MLKCVLGVSTMYYMGNLSNLLFRIIGTANKNDCARKLSEKVVMH